jgi:FKBP-type peptidyl-prolyl cis-trans isomerase
MFGRRIFLWSTFATLAATAGACGGDSDDSPTAPSTPPPQGPAELQITELTEGTGATAANGNTVFINYALWRYDPAGTDGKGEGLETGPFNWVVGSNGAITGMSQGVVGMKVGGIRRLVIPPSLAYGSTGFGNVRPNEWIVFEIQLIGLG